jgi:hypothetical protein
MMTMMTLAEVMRPGAPFIARFAGLCKPRRRQIGEVRHATGT